MRWEGRQDQGRESLAKFSFPELHVSLKKALKNAAQGTGLPVP